MHQDSMQWFPCSVVKWIPSECSGFHAVWTNGSRLNGVDSMQCDWMQWILCRVVQCISIEWSGLHAAWCNWYRLNAWILCSGIECTGLHAAVWNASGVNAVDCMQLGPMDPDWMQWIPCSVVQCIPIECSCFHAAWPNGSRLNAVDSMQHGPIGLDWCTELHAEWLNALDYMQRCEIHPEWMQWIACSLGQCIQVACSGIHAACGNGYRLNAVDSLQNCVIYTNWAVDSMHQDSMQWIQCSVV